ncbi:polyprenyl synthetase family protein [Larsenimonas rhizosphaerae]|uniref:polyprenyl synthetase family protein n=1 Tax=Larsenimonas rhizosphaerae TaxID=2944682 RepID=UPI002033A914|nr:polyprenyl synthetase family protein [Larsenimonas rhizosphaerae]MCM2131100.1 polyprenyl synthetase family protein [Larsenimonas rhizosphaerae]
MPSPQSAYRCETPEPSCLSSDTLHNALHTALLGDNAASDDIITRACRHHLKTTGGLLRARLAFSTARALEIPSTTALTLALIPELLHNASLIHDDVQDRDETRRGHPSLWKAFSAEVALCVGDLHISAAYGCAGALQNYPNILAELITCTHAGVTRTIHGQAQDLAGSAGCELTTYLSMARDKTAPLIGLSLELPLRTGGHHAALPWAAKAVDAFAIAYQIADDIDDIERDALRPGSDNLVHRLAADHPDDALDRAVQMAMHYLDQAETMARQLPGDSGLPLRHETHRLGQRLSTSRDTQ